jgi:hypothetical protein
LAKLGEIENVLEVFESEFPKGAAGRKYGGNRRPAGYGVKRERAVS